MENQYNTYYPSSFLSGEMAEDELTFVDFFPDCVKESGVIASAEFSNFRTLIDRANEWLRTHPQWDIKTCESLEFKARDEDFNRERMVYVDYGRNLTHYIRALRLWIKSSKKERVKQIGYINIVPELKTPAGCISVPIYEDLDDVICRFNYTSRNEPLPGSIITIETIGMKIDRNDFDPDRSNWREAIYRTEFLFIIRIFFEIGEPRYQEIGITDFVPEISATRSCIILRSMVEPLADIVNRVSEWCSRQTNVTICNIQSIASKIYFSTLCLVEVKPQIMFYYKDNRRYATLLAQIMRVAYIKISSFSYNELKDPVSSISCITFAPVQITFPSLAGWLITNSTIPEFESLQETKQRVSAWIKSTGAQVLNMETRIMKLHPRKGAEFSSVETYNYDFAKRNEFYIYVLRAYVIGSYREPLEQTLPQASCIETQSSCVLV